MEPPLLSDWRPRGRYAALEPALLSDWRPRGGYTALEPALLSDWRPRGRYSLWLDFLSDVCKPVGFELLSRGRQFESAFFPALEPKGGVHSFFSAWRHQGGGTRSQKNFHFPNFDFFRRKKRSAKFPAESRRNPVCGRSHSLSKLLLPANWPMKSSKNEFTLAEVYNYAQAGQMVLKIR